MNKDIKINGQSYTAIGKIQVQDSGGAFIDYIHTGDGNVTASDITKDKVAYANGQRIVGSREAPSGSMNIISNGTYDVINKESVVVAVPVGANLAKIAVYVANFTDSTSYSVTKGAVDGYGRILVS